MLDTVLDFLSDASSVKTSRTAFVVSLILVVAAAAFFTVLYIRYERARKESATLTDENLIRRGRLDLKKRCLDANGNVRPDIFQSEQQQQQQQQQQQRKNQSQQWQNENKQQQNDADGTAHDTEKPSMGDQIFETLTSGKLVNMINTFHVRTKGMAKKMEPVISPLERLRAERHARMADESINPLFLMKTQPPPVAESSSSSDDDDSSESVSEFDKEDIVA